MLKVDPRAKVDSTQGFFLLYSTRILSLFSKNENISFLTDDTYAFQFASTAPRFVSFTKQHSVTFFIEDSYIVTGMQLFLHFFPVASYAISILSPKLAKCASALHV